MIKILSLVVYLSSSIYAINFDEFLSNAIKNSPYLQSKELSIKQSSLESDILTRYENPELKLAYAHFKPKNTSNDNGYSIGLTQPVRLWGIAADKNNLAMRSEEKAKANYKLTHAEMVKNISLAFIMYAQKKELIILGEEALFISSHIYDIALQRFKAGTISRGEMLQARVDYEMIEVSLDFLKLKANETYNDLLSLGGYTQEVTLNHKHDFELDEMKNIDAHPQSLYINTEVKEAQAQVHVDSNPLEYIDVFTEFQSELEEDVVSVGISIPLLVFNTKTQEHSIAKLKADSAKLLYKKHTAGTSLEYKKLKKQKILLHILEEKNEKTLASQEELLEMYVQSYKIASINLLALQNIKNQVIQTKEALIKTHTALDANTISTNYILGSYNE